MAIRSRVKKTAKSVVRGAARQVLKTLDRGSGGSTSSGSSRDFGLDQAPGGNVTPPREESAPKPAQTAVVEAAVEETAAPVAEEEAAPEVQAAALEAAGAESREEEPSVGASEPKVALGETERETMREQIVEMIQTVHDPEIPVNIYELGLIYDIDIADSGDVVVKMTLTSPNCPAAQSLPGEVEVKTASVEKVASVAVDVVWDPPWEPSMMSEGAQLELNML